jgi:hypothetical protein
MKPRFTPGEARILWRALDRHIRALQRAADLCAGVYYARQYLREIKEAEALRQKIEDDDGPRKKKRKSVAQED